MVRHLPGSEVFFRPNMMFKEYNQLQDWPRGVIKEVRADGVHVIESWSWRLANGRGATVYAQWSDVRRAPTRTKNQVSGPTLTLAPASCTLGPDSGPGLDSALTLALALALDPDHGLDPGPPPRL